MMESGDRERRVLQNMRRDQCLGGGVEGTFFGGLAAKGSPRHAAQAHADAIGVVCADQNRFTCNGTPVPNDRRVRLFRRVGVGSLRYALPKILLAGKGIRHEELETESVGDDDLRSITDEYDGPVDVGNRLGVVWVTDLDVVAPLLSDLAGLGDRLGWPLKGVPRCVLLAYGRADVPGGRLHVPRSLDGIDRPEFEIVDDCAAEIGCTLPILAPADKGLPEAVHRKCTVQPLQWEMRTIP